MLKGLARVWFGKLPPNTITSFYELSKLFINNFIGGTKAEAFLVQLVKHKTRRKQKSAYFH